MTQDRRGRLRHPLDSLSVRLKVKRSLFNTEWVAVRPLAYSRNKLTLKTDEIMRVGDRIQVSLHLRLDFGDVLIDEAEAIVDSLEKEIGRASCRERVWSSVVSGSITNKAW